MKTLKIKHAHGHGYYVVHEIYREYEHVDGYTYRDYMSRYLHKNDLELHDLCGVENFFQKKKDALMAVQNYKHKNLGFFKPKEFLL